MSVGSGLVAVRPGLVCIGCEDIVHVVVCMVGGSSVKVGHVATIGGGFGTTEVVNWGRVEVGGKLAGSGTESLYEEGTNCRANTGTIPCHPPACKATPTKHLSGGTAPFGGPGMSDEVPETSMST